MKTRYREVTPYRTKDGSFIRELMHPDVHGNRKLSLAEAIVDPGSGTCLHVHNTTEEIYHITAGSGIMTLENEQFPVCSGDTVCIPPGSRHRIENTGNVQLKILCSCAPAYSHKDTEIIAESP